MDCKKIYSPPVTTVNYNYLVIEGMINTGQDSTIITLSRTVNISANISINPELSALVSVENDQNNSYVLKDLGKGKYGAPSLNLDNVHRYRLRVKTNDGNEYLSDFVTPKKSPPIDSVTFQSTGAAEAIYSYTHDPANNTHYYRWEFQETYIYYSPIQTNFVYKNGDIVPATADDEISTCYISDNSSDIIINSSAKLQQDVINKNPITSIPFALDKLKIRYTILVKQYALTSAAFDYYQSLKKNTETIGSIFDTQPSAAVTNIHGVTVPNEQVLGYITAGTVAQLRIFIDRSDLPLVNVGVDYSYCDTTAETYEGSKFPLPNNITMDQETPLDTVIGSADPKTGRGKFTIPYADPFCADCTLKGSNKKPSFWR